MEKYKSLLFCKEPFSVKERARDEKKFSWDMLVDLNLNQLIHSVSAGGNKEYIIELLQTPLKDSEEVYFRQAIFRDLECEAVREGAYAFVKSLAYVEDKLLSLERMVYEEQKEALFLNIVHEYCNAIHQFIGILKSASVKSDGLRMVLECLEEYVASDAYQGMQEENSSLIGKLSAISYNIAFHEDAIVITNANGAEDYNAELLEIFGEFLSQRKRSGYCRRIISGINMNAVEFSILQCIKKLNPQIFKSVHDFRNKYLEFQQEFIKVFCEEIQFYTGYLKYIASLQEAKYPFTYACFVEKMEETRVEHGYDLVLAVKMLNRGTEAVLNDFTCLQNERVYVITGPNQGGKTTFSRMLGQIFYLSLLGVPVPAQNATIVFPKGIFTHFEHEEVAYNDNGKLQDDLLRMKEILENATDSCLILINEMLSSTSYKDALQIGKRLIDKLQMTDNISIYVTFVDELSKADGKVVSMVSVVRDGEQSNRTYRIERQQADGLVYARSLVDKYDLSYAGIKRRLYQNIQG